MILNDSDKVCFIDWQTYFIGNGMVDLSFLLFYGVHIEEFEKDHEFEDKAVRFYYDCMIRHGYGKGWNSNY